jgi:hypothetical protein
MALLTKLMLQPTVAQLLARESREKGFIKIPAQRMNLTFAGPVGDCHAGLTRKSDVRTADLYKRDIDIRNVRQVTILSVEELADIAAALGIPEVKAEWFGANIVMHGLPDLTLLPPSTRLQFPSRATLVVDMENLPCSQVADVVADHHLELRKKLVPAAMHKRGVTAWVECEGDINMGDAVSVFVPPQRHYAHGAVLT